MQNKTLQNKRKIESIIRSQINIDKIAFKNRVYAGPQKKSIKNYEHAQDKKIQKTNSRYLSPQ